MTIKIVRVVGPMQSGRTGILKAFSRYLEERMCEDAVFLDHDSETPPNVPDGTLTVMYDPPFGIDDDEIDQLARHLQQQGVRYLILTQYEDNSLLASVV